jgi:carboxyl-terminal processing protease
LEDRKIIFLINQYTASAAEIFAWVSKEYDDNATIIGEASFGKWSIQTVWPYEDGTSLKLTTAHRLLGKSKTLLEEGKWLQPDIVVVDDYSTIEDEVLNYAIERI